MLRPLASTPRWALLRPPPHHSVFLCGHGLEPGCPGPGLCQAGVPLAPLHAQPEWSVLPCCVLSVSLLSCRCPHWPFCRMSPPYPHASVLPHAFSCRLTTAHAGEVLSVSRSHPSWPTCPPLSKNHIGMWMPEANRSQFSSMGASKLNSGCQSWWQASVSTKPSCSLPPPPSSFLVGVGGIYGGF